MSPKTFIFIGRSGCGKGTQVKNLQEKLKETDPSRNVLYVETGARFRSFFDGNSYSSKLASEVYKTGARQPDFLAVWMWSHIIVDNLKGDEHIIFDGTPRALAEAQILDTAMSFYQRKATVVYLNVSREWSEKRMTERKRVDDLRPEEVKRRLDWFDSDVYPAVEYYSKNPEYGFLDINGEQTVEKVWADISEHLGL